MRKVLWSLAASVVGASGCVSHVGKDGKSHVHFRPLGVMADALLNAAIGVLDRRNDPATPPGAAPHDHGVQLFSQIEEDCDHAPPPKEKSILDEPPYNA